MVTPRQMRAFCERALRGSESLSLAERAVLHEAAANALSGIDPRAARVATYTGSLLRQTEARQLEFSELLRS